MPPRRLPPLPGGALSLGSARALGMSDHDWRDERLVRVTEGVRSLYRPADLRERARAFALALPEDCAFSHVTAARLWGIPLPAALERDELLDVMRTSGRGYVERAGCRSHRGLERRDVHELDGLRVTSLADTWVDLGDVRASRPGRDDLVVAGDAVATLWAPPGVRRTALDVDAAVVPLRRALEARGSPRGRRVLDDALALVRPGVRSPMESRSRLLFVDAGFPEPEPCAPLFTPGADGSVRATSCGASNGWSGSTRVMCTAPGRPAAPTRTATACSATRTGRCARSSPRTTTTPCDAGPCSCGSPASWGSMSRRSGSRDPARGPRPSRGGSTQRMRAVRLRGASSRRQERAQA
ncbi:hypothetical protein G7075_02735 [Phycicoccus sp. HDW14]|uniref:hypothetical protein n=1 Tax=Phycicoccus sp. HDW14 TaxID=2714941 RepID=UPI0014096B0D|nr:hypothetical protein [Phycicoccus sp. HDW14]QIM20312.1 hypothetical protein G7075_02735 [Phycicoccus sp. HDW14]